MTRVSETVAPLAVSIDHGAVRVAVCSGCEWRYASTSLSAVWTAAGRHLRAHHGDLAGGRKALRAAIMAGRREHLTYRLPRGNPEHDPPSGRHDGRGGASGTGERVG